MENFGFALTLIGSSWIAAGFFLKIRDKIDDLRNLAVFKFGHNEGVDDKFRLYLLTKDIKERIMTLVFVMFLYGFSMIVTSQIIPEKQADGISEALRILFLIGGLLGIAGAGITACIGVKDYHLWKSWIEQDLASKDR